MVSEWCVAYRHSLLELAAAASRSKVCPWHRHICLSARVPARRAPVSPLAAAAARRSIAYLVRWQKEPEGDEGERGWEEESVRVRGGGSDRALYVAPKQGVDEQVRRSCSRRRWLRRQPEAPEAPSFGRAGCCLALCVAPCTPSAFTSFTSQLTCRATATESSAAAAASRAWAANATGGLPMSGGVGREEWG